MTPLSREIFDNFQVRKTKKQKEAFIALMSQHFPELRIQEGGIPRCKNIIIGDAESAQVVLSAHYDTCAQLPIPNVVMPKNPLLSILYSLLLIIPLLVVWFLASFAVSILIKDPLVLSLLNPIIYCLLVILLFTGPTNKHNANDNTSGVIALCELLQVLTPEIRSKAAFIFFDHKENGLVGSALFRKKHKKVIKDKLLINLDCISDGDHILVSASKAARNAHGDLLKQIFTPTEDKSILFANAERTYYPSDQLGFKNSVAIAALKYKKFIGYYIDRIHTSRDTVFDKENIKLICESVLIFLKHI